MLIVPPFSAADPAALGGRETRHAFVPWSEYCPTEVEMPGHFTHVYTARRVADWLAEQDAFNPLDSVGSDGGSASALLGGLDDLMKKWPIYTNIGSIGPDLFFFCQDYSSGPLAEFPYEDDLLMLAMAVYYWIDKARDEEWQPLLIILAEVDKTLARIVRLLIKLKKLSSTSGTSRTCSRVPICEPALLSTGVPRAAASYEIGTSSVIRLSCLIAWQRGHLAIGPEEPTMSRPHQRSAISPRLQPGAQPPIWRRSTPTDMAVQPAERTFL